MDLQGSSSLQRCFRNTSIGRLVIYGLIILAIIVVIILLITLMSGDSKSDSGANSGKAILSEVPLIDGYNQLPARLMSDLNGAINNFNFENTSTDKSWAWCQSDIRRLKEGQVGTQIWTIKVPCTSQYHDAAAKTFQILDVISRLLEKYSKSMKLVTSSDEISKSFDDNKIGNMLAIDGGHSIDNKLATLRSFYKLGVRYLSLTSECDTPWSASYTTGETSNFFLTDFGQTVIKEMNRLGMVIDLSHSSVKAQTKVLETSKAPCIFSASAMSALSPIAGNIKDTIIQDIKKTGSVIMITMNGAQLTHKDKDTSVPIEELIAQLNYVREKVGIDNVALAAGFNTPDSIPIAGLEDSSKYPYLFDRLLKPEKGETKWTAEELKKLAWLNFQRVLKKAEEVKEQYKETPNENLIPEDDIPKDKRTCYTKYT